MLDCPENGTLVVGHNAKTHAELEEMIQEGKWSEFIREIPVKKGDFIQINPGTVHAIKGGLMILETQQNSDITYRVYDYDRLSNGKPRQLHVQQSIDVITVPAAPVSESVKNLSSLPKNVWNELYSCKYYTVAKVETDGTMQMPMQGDFLCGSVLAGEGSVNGNPLKKGDHFILTAQTQEVAFEGKMEMILSHV